MTERGTSSEPERVAEFVGDAIITQVARIFEASELMSAEACRQALADVKRTSHAR